MSQQRMQARGSGELAQAQSRMHQETTAINASSTTLEQREAHNDEQIRRRREQRRQLALAYAQRQREEAARLLDPAGPNQTELNTLLTRYAREDLKEQYEQSYTAKQTEFQQGEGSRALWRACLDACLTARQTELLGLADEINRADISLQNLIGGADPNRYAQGAQALQAADAARQAAEAARDSATEEAEKTAQEANRRAAVHAMLATARDETQARAKKDQCNQDAQTVMVLLSALEELKKSRQTGEADYDTLYDEGDALAREETKAALYSRQEALTAQQGHLEANDVLVTVLQLNDNDLSQAALDMQKRQTQIDTAGDVGEALTIESKSDQDKEWEKIFRTKTLQFIQTALTAAIPWNQPAADAQTEFKPQAILSGLTRSVDAYPVPEKWSYDPPRIRQIGTNAQGMKAQLQSTTGESVLPLLQKLDKTYAGDTLEAVRGLQAQGGPSLFESPDKLEAPLRRVNIQAKDAVLTELNAYMHKKLMGIKLTSPQVEPYMLPKGRAYMEWLIRDNLKASINKLGEEEVMGLAALREELTTGVEAQARQLEEILNCLCTRMNDLHTLQGGNRLPGAAAGKEELNQLLGALLRGKEKNARALNDGDIYKLLIKESGWIAPNEAGARLRGIQARYIPLHKKGSRKLVSDSKAQASAVFIDRWLSKAEDASLNDTDFKDMLTEAKGCGAQVEDVWEQDDQLRAWGLFALSQRGALSYEQEDAGREALLAATTPPQVDNNGMVNEAVLNLLSARAVAGEKGEAKWDHLDGCLDQTLLNRALQYAQIRKEAGAKPLNTSREQDRTQRTEDRAGALSQLSPDDKRSLALSKAAGWENVAGQAPPASTARQTLAQTVAAPTNAQELMDRLAAAIGTLEGKVTRPQDLSNAQNALDGLRNGLRAALTAWNDVKPGVDDYYRQPPAQNSLELHLREQLASLGAGSTQALEGMLRIPELTTLPDAHLTTIQTGLGGTDEEKQNALDTLAAHLSKYQALVTLASQRLQKIEAALALSRAAFLASEVGAMEEDMASTTQIMDATQKSQQQQLWEQQRKALEQSRSDPQAFFAHSLIWFAVEREGAGGQVEQARAVAQKVAGLAPYPFSLLVCLLRGFREELEKGEEITLQAVLDRQAPFIAQPSLSDVRDAIGGLMGGRRRALATEGLGEKGYALFAQGSLMDYVDLALCRAAIGAALGLAVQEAPKEMGGEMAQAHQDWREDILFEARNSLGKENVSKIRRRVRELEPQAQSGAIHPQSISNAKQFTAYMKELLGLEANSKACEKALGGSLEVLIGSDFERLFPYVVELLQNRTALDYKKSGGIQEKTASPAMETRMEGTPAELEPKNIQRAIRVLTTLRADAGVLTQAQDLRPDQLYERGVQADNQAMGKAMAQFVLDWKLLGRALRAARFLSMTREQRDMAITQVRQQQIQAGRGDTRFNISAYHNMGQSIQTHIDQLSAAGPAHQSSTPASTPVSTPASTSANAAGSKELAALEALEQKLVEIKRHQLELPEKKQDKSIVAYTDAASAYIQQAKGEAAQNGGWAEQAKTSLTGFDLVITTMAQKDQQYNKKAIAAAGEYLKLDAAQRARVVRLLGNRAALDRSRINEGEHLDEAGYQQAMQRTRRGGGAGAALLSQLEAGGKLGDAQAQLAPQEEPLDGQELDKALTALTARRLSDRKMAVWRRNGGTGDLSSVITDEAKDDLAVYDWELMRKATELTAAERLFSQRALLEARGRQIQEEESAELLQRFNDAQREVTPQIGKKRDAGNINNVKDKAAFIAFLLHHQKADFPTGEGAQAQGTLQMIKELGELNDEELALLLGALANRSVADLQKKGIHGVRVGSIRRRSSADAQGRELLLEAFATGQLAGEGEEYQRELAKLFPQAAKGLLTRQVDDAQAFTQLNQPQIKVSWLSTEQRGVLLDWKLLRRALLLLTSARMERDEMENIEMLAEMGGTPLTQGQKAAIRRAMREQPETVGTRMFWIFNSVNPKEVSLDPLVAEEGEEQAQPGKPLTYSEAAQAAAGALVAAFRAKDQFEEEESASIDKIKGKLDADKPVTLAEARKLEKFLHMQSHFLGNATPTLDLSLAGEQAAPTTEITKEQGDALKAQLDQYDEAIQAMQQFSDSLDAASGGVDLLLLLASLKGFVGSNVQLAHRVDQIATQMVDLGRDIFQLAILHDDVSETQSKHIDDAMRAGTKFEKLGPGSNKQLLAGQSLCLLGGAFDLSQGIFVLQQMRKDLASPPEIMQAAANELTHLAAIVDGCTGLVQTCYARDMQEDTNGTMIVQLDQLGQAPDMTANLATALDSLQKIAVGLKTRQMGELGPSVEKLSSAVASLVATGMEISSAQDRFNAAKDQRPQEETTPPTQEEKEAHAKAEKDKADAETLRDQSYAMLSAELAKGGMVVYQMTQEGASAKTNFALALCATRTAGHLSNLLSAYKALGSDIDVHAGSAAGSGHVLLGAASVAEGIYDAFTAFAQRQPSDLAQAVGKMTKGAVAVAQGAIKHFAGGEDTQSAAIGKLAGVLADGICEAALAILNRKEHTALQTGLQWTKVGTKAVDAAAEASQVTRLFDAKRVDADAVAGLRIAAAGTRMAVSIASYFAAPDEQKEDERALLVTQLGKDGTQVVANALKLSGVTKSMPVAGLVANGTDALMGFTDMGEAIRRRSLLEAACGNAHVDNMMQLEAMKRRYLARHGVEKEDLVGDWITDDTLRAQLESGVDADLAILRDDRRPEEEWSRVLAKYEASPKVRKIHAMLASRSRSVELGRDFAAHVLNAEIVSQAGSATFSIAKGVVEVLLSPLVGRLVSFAIDAVKQIGTSVIRTWQQSVWSKQAVKKHFRFPILYTQIPKEAGKVDKDEYVLKQILHFRQFTDCGNLLKNFVASKLYAQGVVFPSGGKVGALCADALGVLSSLGVKNIKAVTPLRIAALLS